jgi:Lsr2
MGVGDESEVIETITFSLDGKDYEMTASSSDASELREKFRPYLERSRRVPHTVRRRRSGRRN